MRTASNGLLAGPVKDPACNNKCPAEAKLFRPAGRSLSPAGGFIPPAEGGLLQSNPTRILWVFAWLVVGGEETEVRLLARALDPAEYRIDVVACFRNPGMPEQTHEQLQALGIDVDGMPYTLSFDETVAYLAEKMRSYDLVVASQAVPDVVPALERIRAAGEPPPPLIEHGGLVEEALCGPKHLTRRYVGVCGSIRAAAASRLPERPKHALSIPSMVDLAEFTPAERPAVRREWGIADDELLVGWVGRLDRKKRVEDFVRAATLLQPRRSEARFVVIGGPDAFMPEYADELRALAAELGVADVVRFTGDRADVPRLPVIATRDNGTAEQIRDGETGLFVPHEDPAAVAAAVERLLADPALRCRLGDGLRRHVANEYSTGVVARRWETLFRVVLAEGARV